MLAQQNSRHVSFHGCDGYDVRFLLGCRLGLVGFGNADKVLLGVRDCLLTTTGGSIRVHVNLGARLKTKPRSRIAWETVICCPALFGLPYRLSAPSCGRTSAVFNRAWALRCARSPVRRSSSAPATASIAIRTSISPLR